MKFSIILFGFFVGVFARPEAPIAIEPSGSYLPGHTSVPVFPPTTYPGIIDYDRHDHGHTHHDQRHVYFYAAPDDEAAAHFRIYVAPSSQRNTKIIFVKAPSYGGVIPEVIAPPSHAEDKTKIYVLVKKPHHGGSVTIPSSLGVKQAKPEVFFIKYRNEHDASAAVSQGLHGGSVGTHLENLGSEQSFIRTLESRHHVGITGGIGGDIIDDSILARGKYGPPTTYGTPGESGPYKK